MVVILPVVAALTAIRWNFGWTEIVNGEIPSVTRSLVLTSSRNSSDSDKRCHPQPHVVAHVVYIIHNISTTWKNETIFYSITIHVILCNVHFCIYILTERFG